MTTNADDFLEHYGVKGMRWGFRKDRRTGMYPRRSDIESSTRRERRRTVRNRRTLSDSEIRETIDRIRLEKQLRDLINEDLSPGRTFVADVLKGSGRKVLSTAATGGALYLIRLSLERKWDPKTAAKYVTGR